jgi:hypothetical protein
MIGDGTTGRQQQDWRAPAVQCTECDRSSGARWSGWRAYRTDVYRADELELAEPPALAFYCPECAEREFGNQFEGGQGHRDHEDGPGTPDEQGREAADHARPGRSSGVMNATPYDVLLDRYHEESNHNPNERAPATDPDIELPDDEDDAGALQGENADRYHPKESTMKPFLRWVGKRCGSILFAIVVATAIGSTRTT